ncbi:alpha/beta fold hydrolase [Thiotrichales bacterium 19S3-7]|nr:alpha/beta fold hydrolase [Thiotrichales bacterium 19S3-7]MCF6802382.1 alpha/beta fold hydrolase [Thiotrichales bacterium 19S3-11]
MNTYQHHINQVKSLSLSDYILLTRHHVEQTAHSDNSPFFLQGDHQKPLVILTHGFSSSAYAMRSLALELNQQGFNCFAPLLLGHGTAPNNLLDIPYLNWIDQLDHLIMQAALDYKRIHLIGHSYGGLLSTLSALKHPDIIQSITLFAPAFGLTSPWISSLPPLISPISKIIPVKPFTHVKSLCGTDIFSYNEFPMQAAAEVVKHIKKAKELLKAPLKQPIFMVVSTEDETTAYQAGLEFFRRQDNVLNYCRVYTALDDFQSDNNQIKIINSRDFSAQVVDFSHLGMHIDINDPHYGIEGSYYHNTKPYPMIFGAINPKNKLKIKNLRRIAFNPDFATLSQKVIQFLNQLE